MTAEQIAEKKTQMAARPREYKDGYTAAMHDVARELADDAHELGDNPPREHRPLREFLVALSRELAADAEALRQ